MKSSNNLQHLGIIMDGNRRWAKERKKPISYGHKVGVLNIKKLVDNCLKRNIESVTLYTFSLDNWKREAKEVSYLFSLVSTFFDDYIDELVEKDVKLNWIGISEGLPKSVVKTLLKSERKTRKCKTLTLNLVFNYSGHLDFLETAKNIANDVKDGLLKVNEIDDSVIQSHLLSNKVAPIDLLIRTSGEERTSDFMPYQLAYSELYFTKTYWPDFNDKELDKAIRSYKKRNRRFGGQ